MNNLLSAIKSFVLKNRPAYKDDLGNGKYDVKKLPEECVPDGVINDIRKSQSTADAAQITANAAQSTANALKENPVFTGSFSQNRKESSEVGNYSHAEGYNTTASGGYSHTEGYNTTASGFDSHAEGCETTASNGDSHAEGFGTTASGETSHAEGYHTKASGNCSHAQGKYNIDDLNEKYAHIVGNGTSDTARSNAHTLDWEGNAWYAGTVEGTAMIVKSSTPDSTKKFKITVEDDARPTFTDTSNPNNTWTPGDSRYIINGHIWNYNGVNYIGTDETPDQLTTMYESGKDIFLDFNEERFKYTGSLFYTIMVMDEDNTGIKGAAITIIGSPMVPDVTWDCPYKGVCVFGVFQLNIQ